MSDQTTVTRPDRSPDPQHLIQGGNSKADYSYWAVSRLNKRRRPPLEQNVRPTP